MKTNDTKNNKKISINTANFLKWYKIYIVFQEVLQANNLCSIHN